MRRSVIVTRNIKKGEVLTKESLDVKRPGTGLPPEKLNSLVGKTLLRDIESDTIILAEDLR
jgi:N-acetylneuraminate synthase